MGSQMPTMSFNGLNMSDFETFGPTANCTLALCPIQWSVYQYRPSLPGNSVFLALFGLAALVHLYLGIRWKSFWFMYCMITGCAVEIAGYAGRIILYNNPWSFVGFMIQIVLITTAPVFYTAAIYVTLAKVINNFGPQLSRFSPTLFYWIFIPIDIVCLILQATGGALSASSSGGSQSGVDIALAGLGIQVASLVVFSILMADYLIRYFRANSAKHLGSRFICFITSLTTAIVLILGRCAYRCQELSQGYQNSTVITDQALFIALEGGFVIVAAFALCIGHPGLLFNSNTEKGVSSRSSKEEMSLADMPVQN